jgi:hypothetical protein
MQASTNQPTFSFSQSAGTKHGRRTVDVTWGEAVELSGANDAQQARRCHSVESPSHPSQIYRVPCGHRETPAQEVGMFAERITANVDASKALRLADVPSGSVQLEQVLQGSSEGRVELESPPESPFCVAPRVLPTQTGT